MTTLVQARDGRVIKLTALLLLSLILWSVASPIATSAMVGLGGYISEKLLGNGTNAMLSLGDGTNNLTVVGSGPAVATGVATSYPTGNLATVAMTGNLQSLNGMPRADVWFRWGYTPGSMSNATAVVTVTSTGEQTASINPNAGAVVYYRFQASTDGTSSGAILSITAVGSGHVASHWMLNALLPILVASAILIGVFLLTRNPLAAFVSAIVGLVGFYLVLALVSSL